MMFCLLTNLEKYQVTVVLVENGNFLQLLQFEEIKSLVVKIFNVFKDNSVLEWIPFSNQFLSRLIFQNVLCVF